MRRRLADVLASTVPDELMIMKAMTNVDERLQSMRRVHAPFDGG